MQSFWQEDASLRRSWVQILVPAETFFFLFKSSLKGSPHLGRSFIYWAHVTYLTCNANVQSIITSETWIDLMCPGDKKKDLYERRFHSENFSLASNFESATFRPSSTSFFILSYPKHTKGPGKGYKTLGGPKSGYSTDQPTIGFYFSRLMTHPI